METISLELAETTKQRLVAGCETLHGLLSGLIRSQGSIAVKVHQIRKLGKSLRGGFSLFCLGDSSAREVQAIGRMLSGSRDAVSRLNTWQRLEWASDPISCRAIGVLLDRQVEMVACKPPVETLNWCLIRVSRAQSMLEDLESAALPHRIAKGLKKLGKRVRKKCRHLDDAQEEAFHDARKGLKAYLGALDYLPAERWTPDPEMAALAELLGDENDLATLSIWLRDHGFTHILEPDLWDCLKISRTKVQRKAVRDAAQIALPNE